MKIRLMGAAKVMEEQRTKVQSGPEVAVGRGECELQSGPTE
jgi:hypothetical protein